MSSEARDWLSHMIENLERIASYIGDPPDLDRLEDSKTRDAIERCLERISEAASRFDRAGIDLAAMAPEVPWSDIRAFGNYLRHEYDGLDEDVVTGTVRHDLGPLRAAVGALKDRF